jgi:hypothetical protein
MMQEIPRAIALIHSAAHLSSVASITNWLSRITIEECNQFGCFGLLTRLTCECYSTVVLIRAKGISGFLVKSLTTSISLSPLIRCD